MIYQQNKGITIIEILVIITIIGIVSSIVFMSLSGFRNEQALKNASADIVSLLNKAKSNTLTSLNSTNYGVHFDSDKAVLFVGPTYVSNATTNEIVVFNSAVSIPTPSGINIGGGSDVLYTRLTGDTIGGTITVQLTSNTSKQKIITINKTGIASSN